MYWIFFPLFEKSFSLVTFTFFEQNEGAKINNVLKNLKKKIIVTFKQILHLDLIYFIYTGAIFFITMQC